MFTRNALAGGLALVAAIGLPQSSRQALAGTITITNNSGKVLTLSDLYSREAAGKVSTTHLKKGDSKDDISLANGGKKDFTVPDKHKHFTVSWLNNEGKEVETDTDLTNFEITAQNLVMFDVGTDVGQHAILFDALQGAVPAEGSAWTIRNGKIVGDGGLYDWITFYDTTAGDGFIEYDDGGNVLSPLLPSGVAVASFEYSMQLPEPASAGLLAAGALVLGAWRRR
jgi:hypothetical protein